MHVRTNMPVICHTCAVSYAYVLRGSCRVAQNFAVNSWTQSSYYKRLRFVRLSVPSNWGNNQLRDKSEKGTMERGSGMRLSWRVVGGAREGKWETQKHAFRRRGLYTFIISRTFARGRYRLCNAFGDLEWSGLEVGDDVVVGVGCGVWGKGVHVCRARILVVFLIPRRA